ncbi:hypothetical protein EGR_09322 [Echinococcus granulosus]|uniref:SANTA domain-containing protein n=1 Tax=Echinococcus granulosus TaxID=6210 RepID=W6U5G4_ECHGR|nr:hypothetical protein EGR_09322 [Echinococcus granulosus]EUB55806.1 hypothetical protein EGR_09322 [Echinococcus granulosus]
MNHFFSPLTFPSQPYYFGRPIVLSLPQFSNSFPSNDNLTTQVPVSVPMTPQSMPTPVVPNTVHLRSSSPPTNADILSVPIAQEHADCATEISSICPEPTDTIISIKNWVAVNLEEDGECRIAGRYIKSGQLICSDRIVFVNYRGDIASDGKRLFKLCGPISWELYKLQHPQVGEINPTMHLRKAFSNGFPPKNRRNWMRALYRFLYRLTQQKPSFRQTRLKSPALADGIRDVDATTLEPLDVDPRSDNTLDLPFLVLNSPSHYSRRKRRSSSKRHSDSPDLHLVLSNLHPLSSSQIPHKSCYSDPSSDTESIRDENEPIPSASVLNEIDSNDFSTRGRRNPTWGGKASSSSPLTVEMGVQTSNDFSPSRLASTGSSADRKSRRDVATETRRTRERTPVSNWMEEDLRLNMILRNADIERTPLLSRPSQTLPSHKLHSHGLRRRQSEKEARVLSSGHSAKGSAVVDMDAQVFFGEQEDDNNSGDDMVAESSRCCPYSSQKSKGSSQSRTPKNSACSLPYRLEKKAPKKLRIKEARASSTSSTSNRKSHSRSRESLHNSHHKYQQQDQGQGRHQDHTLDRRHQLITQLGVVDVRDLRRTRSGRLSVPTRDTWHRQKIVFDGADISVDHGEYGKHDKRLDRGRPPACNLSVQSPSTNHDFTALCK